MGTRLNVCTSTMLVKLAVAVCLACACFAWMCGCSSQAGNEVKARGTISTADGVVLAQSKDVKDGKGAREYPQGDAYAAVTGSCLTKDAPWGIEQEYADQLESGSDVELTIQSSAQRAAAQALGEHTGAIVVLDSRTGAVLAMASTPSYDPNAAKAEDDLLANRATELHIPGSTFKTITLAAALESGAVRLDSVIPAPTSLAFNAGYIENYDAMQYDNLPLIEAYAKSVNTVFAQLALMMGAPALNDMAQRFGFDSSTMTDFNVPASTISGLADMDDYMLAWTGVGQALYQADGTLQGPLMTAVEGASIASVVQSGGAACHPFIVKSVGESPMHEDDQAGNAVVSPDTADALKAAMLTVVEAGTGSGAAVQGVTVGGKTGTADTASGLDDSWFIGFAEDGDNAFAFAVLLEGEGSATATQVASRLITGLTS